MGLGSILGAVGGALLNPMVSGSALGGAGTIYQNYAQQKAAGKQMEFQGLMSSSAYSRAMADMRRAGLNPILAGKLGGASTPGGAMPIVHDPMSSAMKVAQGYADTELKGQQTQLTEYNAMAAGMLAPTKKAAGNVLNDIVGGVQDMVINGQPQETIKKKATEMFNNAMDWMEANQIPADKVLSDTAAKLDDFGKAVLEMLKGDK